jgi:hypothetical protein
MSIIFINQWRVLKEISFIALEMKQEYEGVYLVFCLLGFGFVIYIRK